jgi:hypothetical protein
MIFGEELLPDAQPIRGTCRRSFRQSDLERSSAARPHRIELNLVPGRGQSSIQKQRCS